MRSRQLDLLLILKILPNNRLTILLLPMVVKLLKKQAFAGSRKGLNYYYYQIRHDNTTDIGHMAYGKYGVVRNNYYTLNLTKVNGCGTAWYPDVEEPEEEIDKKGAYLHFEIEVAPWISWGTDFEI